MISFVLDFVKTHLAVVHPHNFAFAYQRLQNKVFIDLEKPVKSSKKIAILIDLFTETDCKDIKAKTWDRSFEELTSVEHFVKPFDAKKTELKIMNAFSLSNEQR